MSREPIDRLFARLQQLMAGAVRRDVPLAKHSTLRVGGPAAVMAVADSLADLRVIMETAEYYHVPVLVLGRGSNILVSDRGFPGVVLSLGKEFSHIRHEGTEIVAGGGASLAGVARYAATHGLSGLAFAVGIPGTVGAAIAVNAGAYGRDMAAVTQNVTVYDSDRTMSRLGADELGFAYRSTSLAPGWLIIEATLELAVGDTEEIEREMEENFRLRKQAQPLNLPNAGSIFKNPRSDLSAGKLIEECGCKGLRIGGAQVSDKHANFIVNTGDATASDVYRLIDTVRSRVKEQGGIELQPEVRIIGSFD